MDVQKLLAEIASDESMSPTMSAQAMNAVIKANNGSTTGSLSVSVIVGILLSLGAAYLAGRLMSGGSK